MERCTSENLKHRYITLYITTEKLVHNWTKFLIKQLSKCSIQNQLHAVVLQTRYFLEFLKIHRKVLVKGSLF